MIIDPRTRRILQLTSLIEHSLAEPLTLSDMARYACYSPFHFERVFAGLVGATPADFVRQRRLVRVAARLRYDLDSVFDIALDCGFTNASSFSRIFRQHFGFSPRDWRHGAWYDFMWQSHQKQLHSIQTEGNTRSREWLAWQAALQQTRFNVTSRIRIHQLAPTRYWHMRHFRSWDERARKEQLRMVCSLQESHQANEDSIWCSVMHNDNGLTLNGTDMFDWGILANEVAPEGLMHSTLPGGYYASLDIFKSDCISQWLHEDWLDKQSVWTFDPSRPYITLFYNLRVNELSNGRHMVPIRRRLDQR